jgi:SPP1 gp7 family putative phage head morphogenesis protein
VIGTIAPDALPPEDAIALLARKAPVDTRGWRDLFRAEHARYFTVAQSAGYDVSRDIQESLIKALREGQSFEQWKKDLIPILQQKGWWLDRHKETDRLLGTPRRLVTIWQTNMRAVHNAARYARAQAHKDLLPYIRYRALLDDRTRPQHAAWNDIILPVDHPFWQTHLPPNSWNCRCGWSTLTRRQAERLGGVTGESLLPRDRSGLAEGFDYILGSDIEAKSQALLGQKVARYRLAAKQLARSIDDAKIAQAALASNAGLDAAAAGKEASAGYFGGLLGDKMAVQAARLRARLGKRALAEVSDGDVLALQGYTQFDHPVHGGIALNRVLRFGGATEMQQHLIMSVHRVLAALPDVRWGGYLRRATDLPDAVFDEMVRSGRFVDAGFMSTSRHGRIVKGKRYLFLVEPEGGKLIRKASLHGAEDEVLFAPGTAFEAVVAGRRGDLPEAPVSGMDTDMIVIFLKVPRGG